MITQIETGDLIDEKYEVTGFLGEGGMGRVYLAFDRNLDRPVAIKTFNINSDDYSDEEIETFKTRFLFEARAISKLEHPHIIQIYNMGKYKGLPYFVMQYFSGIPINKWGDKNNPSYEQWLNIALKILSALQHAHDNDIVHRDIKRTNILAVGAANNPQIKLIDFGICTNINPNKTRITSIPGAIGTAGSIDPYVLFNPEADYTPQSDLYSFGVLLYRFLCKKKPHLIPEKATFHTINEIGAENKIILPHCANHEIIANSQIETLLISLLASKREDRPLSARDTALLIDAIIKDLPNNFIITTKKESLHSPCDEILSIFDDDILQEASTAEKNKINENTQLNRSFETNDSASADYQKKTVILTEKTASQIDTAVTMKLPIDPIVDENRAHINDPISSVAPELQKLLYEFNQPHKTHKFWKKFALSVAAIFCTILFAIFYIQFKENKTKTNNNTLTQASDMPEPVQGRDLDVKTDQSKESLDRIIESRNKEKSINSAIVPSSLPLNPNLSQYSENIQAYYQTNENLNGLTVMRPKIVPQESLGSVSTQQSNTYNESNNIQDSIKKIKGGRLDILNEQKRQLKERLESKKLDIPVKSTVRAKLLVTVNTSDPEQTISATLTEPFVNDAGVSVLNIGDTLKGHALLKDLRAYIQFDTIEIAEDNNKPYSIKAIALAKDKTPGLVGLVEFAEPETSTTSSFLKDTVKDIGSTVANQFIPGSGGIIQRTATRASDEAQGNLKNSKTPQKTISSNRVTIQKNSIFLVQFIK